LGNAGGLARVQDAEVLAVLVDNTNLARSNSLINPVLKPGGFVLMTSSSSTDDGTPSVVRLKGRCDSLR
jgi:hypothetical protein